MSYSSFEKNIVFRFSRGDDPVCIFEEEDNENYLELNEQLKYTEYFIYAMIKNNIDIHSFTDVIHHIYDKYNNLSFIFNAFFSKYKPVCLKDFLLNKFPTKDISEQSYYLFLNFEPFEQDIILNKQNLPYLLKMIEALPEGNLSDLWNGGYGQFLGIFESNWKHITPLLNITLHHSESELIVYLFNTIKSEPYTNKKLLAHSMLDSIPHLEKIVFERIFIHQPFEGSIIDILDFYVALVNPSHLVKNINHKINELIDVLYAEEWRQLVHQLHSFLDKKIQYIPDFEINYDEINLEKTGFQNIIYLICINNDIQHNKLNIPSEVALYCFQCYEQFKKDNFFNFHHLFSKKFIQYIDEIHSVIELRQQFEHELSLKDVVSKPKL